MEEYDDFDDFDDMYGDEYEAMLDMEGAERSNTQTSIQHSEDIFPTQPQSNESLTPIAEPTVEESQSKRTLEDLFGEIDDILAESPYAEAPAPKKTKVDPAKDDNLQLIDRILQLREVSKYQLDSLMNNDVGFGQHLVDIYDEKYSVAYDRPEWPYVRVKLWNGHRKYVRFHNREFEDEEVRQVQESLNGENGVSLGGFGEVWKEALEIIKLQEEATLAESNETISTPAEISLADSKCLWVEKYKPQRYLELLSDESTNRILLRWIKLWDKVVFNKRSKIKPIVLPVPPFQGAKAGKFTKFQKFQRPDVTFKLDEDGRPEFKVALLCGPPGLGKTTLAHLVARHAGYNPLEVNASDDRSIDSFRTTLERGTQMRSVLDRDNRPNCIIFDEIDGAPPSSIDFLIKYISGTYKGKATTKGRKDKKSQHQALKRPIICICNDMHVPALRPLRQISFLVNFPPTESARLAERLLEISAKQTVETNLTALLALSEKSNNDIRSCLSVLQFFRAQNKPVRLDDVLNTSVGQKDIQKGLFSIWQDVFQIQRPRNRDKVQEITARSRLRYVISSILAFGDYDRVMHGIFENYPNMKVKGRCVPEISSSLDWFSQFDLISKRMLHTQNYSLNGYLPYAFVVWHFSFGSFGWQKLQYPNTDYEVRTKQQRNAFLLADILKGTQPYLKPYVHKKNLSQDILPYLSNIIAPSFRPVDTHLYTEREKQRLQDIISKMIDYNITYVQERTVEGEYVYNMDPNISVITEFPSVIKKSQQISYSNKQLIAREVELEKMRRTVEFKKREKDADEKGKNLEGHKSKNKDNIEKLNKAGEKLSKATPNHLQQLTVAKGVKKISPVMERDIFGKVVQKSNSSRVHMQVLNDVCFHYNEGFTNAVRRPILMKDLL